MAKYDKDALRELCSKVDLFEYASKSFEFEKHGDGFATNCPRHIDKTPSLIVTPGKNLFHCFSCGVAGNILNWLMIFEHLSFDDSVKKIGSLTGVDINNLKQCSALAVYKDMRGISQVQNKMIPTQRIILDENEIMKYLDESPQEWIDEGIDPEIMKRYSVRIDNRSNRIVYPVYDAEFNLIGFKGRTRFKNYKDMKIQKYQNYQKIGTTDFFIGMKENHDLILEKNEVIIFEGIKSGMKAEKWDYGNWSSSETGWLNDEQVLILIKMGIRDVVIAYDNDVPIEKIRECTKKLRKFTNVYMVRDRKKKKDWLLGNPLDKLSPVDNGREVWETLYNERKRVI